MHPLNPYLLSPRTDDFDRYRNMRAVLLVLLHLTLIIYNDL